MAHGECGTRTGSGGRVPIQGVSPFWHGQLHNISYLLMTMS
jgi:hypothetical protein